VLQIRSGDRLRVLEHLRGLDAELAEELDRVLALVFEQALVRHGVDRHHAPGGHGQHGLRVGVRQAAPHRGFRSGRHVVAAVLQFGRLVAHRLQDFKLLGLETAFASAHVAAHTNAARPAIREQNIRLMIISSV